MEHMILAWNSLTHIYISKWKGLNKCSFDAMKSNQIVSFNMTHRLWLWEAQAGEQSAGTARRTEIKGDRFVAESRPWGSLRGGKRGDENLVTREKEENCYVWCTNPPCEETIDDGSSRTRWKEKTAGGHREKNCPKVKWEKQGKRRAGEKGGAQRRRLRATMKHLYE